MLKYATISRKASVFDAGVAAYLLNPLKSSYTHDDIAKEFLGGILLPAKEDLLGKKSLSAAYESDEEGLVKYASYIAATALLCVEPISAALKEAEMWEVYEKIELPLVFTLDSMEKYGKISHFER